MPYRRCSAASTELRSSISCGNQVAPAEYMVRPPQPPVFMFVIDVSAPAVASGMVHVAAETIKACLDNLPGEDRTLVSGRNALCWGAGETDIGLMVVDDKGLGRACLVLLCHLVAWRGVP